MSGVAPQKFLKFALSGGTSAVLNILLLYVFVGWLGMWYLPASILAFILAMIVHFLMQKLWVFTHKEAEGVHVQFIKFFLLALLNLAVNSVGMYVLVGLIALNYLLAQIIVRIVLAILNYFVYERLVFIRVPHTGQQTLQ